MRKTKMIEEVVALQEEEAAEVGQRMTGSKDEKPKKRKFIVRELSFSSSPSKLKRRRGIHFTEDNSTSPVVPETSNQLLLSSPKLTHALPSYCSSNDSSRLAEQNFADLEEEEASSVELATSATHAIRRSTKGKKTSPPRDQFQAEPTELESDTTSSGSSPANSLHHSTAVKMVPSDAELEDFFSTAEKDLRKQFAKKYNFDIVKEEALEGRYEWVRVSP